MKRWQLWLVGLLLFVGAFFWHPAVYWRVVGWNKGEAFYHGRPSSYWARDVLQCYGRLYHQPPLLNSGSKVLGEPVMGPTGWYRQPTEPSFLDNLEEWCRSGSWGGNSILHVADTPLLQEDADCLPVLLELLGNAEPKVREVAVAGLSCPRLQNPEVRRALEKATQDEAAAVRKQAVGALQSLDNPDAVRGPIP